MRKALFILCCSIAGANAQPFNPKIINGVPGTTKDYPWVVNYEGCGGSLISAEWVLTAAHCFNDASNTGVNTSIENRSPVILLSDNIQPPSADAQTIPISQIITHPSYNISSFDNDIALIKLSRAVSNPTPVGLNADTVLAENTRMTALGWGATLIDANNKPTNLSPILLKIDQVLVSQTACQQAYNQANTAITDNMLCFNSVPGQQKSDTCQGDSGGPAVVAANNSFVQVGVVSFGPSDPFPPCGSPNFPGVYAKVANYQAWIKSYVPDAKFVATSSVKDTSCDARVDGSLNVHLACLAYQGKAYQTDLLLTGNLQWRWSGTLQASTCPLSTAACVSLDSGMNLQLPRVTVSGQSYNVKLRYAPEVGSTSWVFQSSAPN